MGTLIKVLLVIFLLKLIFGWVRKRRRERGDILVVLVDGVLQYDSEKKTKFDQLISSLKKVSELEPKALVVRINSPGGTIGASQEIFSFLRSLSDQGIKVVALLEDVAASGGLYVAMAADHIVANAGTVTGSIGVILSGWDYSKLLDLVGLKINTIKSGEFKDIMSPNREMTDRERELLGSVVQDVYGEFCSVVAERRGLDLDKVKSFADGRIFTGRKAFELGLVDSLGSLNEAVEAASELAGLTGDVKVVHVDRKGTLLDKVGLGGVRGRFEDLLPNASIEGIPLWLMPRFK